MYVLFAPSVIAFALAAVIEVVSELRGGKSNL
jgi:hypothetical protein